MTSMDNFNNLYGKTNSLYIIIITFIFFFIAALPFIHTDISIKSSGITRPENERTEVKPIITGIIDTIYLKEGDMVNKDAVILRLKDPNTRGKLIMNNFEISQAFIKPPGKTYCYLHLKYKLSIWSQFQLFSATCKYFQPTAAISNESNYL